MRSEASAERSLRKKPRMRRYSVRLFLLLVAMLDPAWLVAQDAPIGSALTEEEAVRRALSRTALTELMEGLVGIARSEEVREGLWPDPEISYNREETLGAQGAAQDFVTLSQSFDLSGRRGLRREAAGHRVRAATHQGETRRLEIEAEVRLRFHQLLAAQLRVRSIGVWTERIEKALGIVTRREAAGDAAAYDRRRLERELANARGRLSVHKAEGGQAWARLAGLLGETNPADNRPPQLSGSLRPERLLSTEQLVTRLEKRPDVLALGAHEEAARVDAEAASRWWVPQPTLLAGWTGVDLGTERADGYVAMVTLSVPLFDRNQDESLRAASAARVAHGRRELTLTEALAEARGRVAELNRLIEVAQRFRREVAEGSGPLVRTAEIGYAGDELGILELLDAYRGAFDDEMTALDLELTTRRARIELDLITGGYIP